MEKENPPFTSRIAPTPSGLLHIGNAFSFVLTWLITRKSGGKLLLRIDDSDATRSRPEYIEDIFYTIEWLGIDYDLGPEGPEDFAGNFSQHHRMNLYHDLLKDLQQQSGLVYACSCSRKQILKKNKTGLYTGTCRKRLLSPDHPSSALRIQVPENTVISYPELLRRQEEQVFLGKEMGDFVVRRKDRLPAYQLVSLADDLHFGINLVVRGKDLQLSTAAQLYLAGCLSSTAPDNGGKASGFLKASFVHHPLLLDEKGQKLSKSKGAVAVAEMRKSGKSPETVFRQVARFAGLPEQAAASPEELLEAFDLSFLQENRSLS